MERTITNVKEAVRDLEEELKQYPLCKALLEGLDSIYKSNDKEGECLHWIFAGPLGYISASSNDALKKLKGLKTNVQDLYETWKVYKDSTQYRLARIEWFREAKHVHHEYLLACINKGQDLPADTQNLWLRLERRPKSSDQVEHARELLTRLNGHFEADDIITISGQRADLFEGEEPAPHTTIPFDTDQRQPSLMYMLEVLRIIHQESPKYYLVGANCWFFAATLVDALLKKVEPEPERCGHHCHCHNHDYTKKIFNGTEYKSIMERVDELLKSIDAPNTDET